MIAIAVAHGKIAHSRNIVEANLQEIYEFSYELLLEEIYPNGMPSRLYDYIINTLANKMYEIL
jgi:hypothetical protein